MKRTAKKIIVAATIAAVSLSGVPTANACGGGGRSRISRPAVSFGFGGASFSRPAKSYARPSYSQPQYTQPTYQHSTYQQPVYQQPVYAKPAYSSSTQSQTIVSSRPMIVSQPKAQLQQAQLPQTPSVVQSKPQSNPSVAKPAATNDAETSALAALAAIASDEQAAEPASKLTAASASIPQFAPAATKSELNAPAHVGTWTATLPSKVSITLQLNADGLFSWSVNNNGQSTQFSGQYRIDGGRLTLVRSNDLQQMAGKWTGSADGFKFKLDGANNGGLNFRKA